VLTSEESSGPPHDDDELPVGADDHGVWMWLVTRDVPDGLSAQEMADDLRISYDEAGWRLLGAAALGLAREVTPGRFRPGTGHDV
jgi:hypothetical protein